MIDWKLEIARMGHWKQIAANYDPEHLYPFHIPGVAASPFLIAATEAAAGVQFPAQYKEFLGYGDGWRALLRYTDLFGTNDFRSGRSRRVQKRPDIVAFVRDHGLECSVPVGSSPEDAEVFLLVPEESKILPGGVVWYFNEEIDRFDSFHEFFASMINYNAELATMMKHDYEAKRR